MNTPLTHLPDCSIAVIMRTKNSASILAQTLSALFSQNYVNFQLFIIDSGSNDTTLEIAQKYPCSIRSIFAQDYYPGSVLNDAIASINHDLLVFLNSDTVFLTPDSLSHLLAVFKDTQIVAAFARQLPRPDAELWVQRDYAASFPALSPAPPWMHLSLCCAAIRRSSWEKRPFYTAAWGSEDNEWGYQAQQLGGVIAYVPLAMTMHSHNYTLRQLYGRRFIEGEADAYIYPSLCLSLSQCCLRWIKSIIRDFLFYVKMRALCGILFIPIQRFVYHWAYYKGLCWGSWRQKNNNSDVSIGQKTVLSRYETK